MPVDPVHDDFLPFLGDIEGLLASPGVDGVLRAIVTAACRVTASRRGAAGLNDGEATSCSEWYEVDAGWTPTRLRWELGEGVPGRVCLSAKPMVCNHVQRDTDGFDEATEELGLVNMACVPLLGDDGALGFLEVADRGGRYSDDDVDCLAALARLACSRLHEITSDGRQTPKMAAQADIAERLQRRLLPAEPPELVGLDIAFRYRSASTGILSGGDFVDYYSRSPNTLAFAIGDVAGKGVEAMATTFVTKYILRAAVHGGQLSWPTRPGAALQELRTGLLEQPDFTSDTERFVTVLFGLISTRRGTLQLASAGHPTPFIVRATGTERPLLLTEPAIGIELGAALAPYPTETIELSRGDVVVLFTDGVTELRDADGTFFEEVMGTLLDSRHDVPAASVVESVIRAADEFSARAPADDLALLCIRLTADVAVD